MLVLHCMNYIWPEWAKAIYNSYSSTLHIYCQGFCSNWNNQIDNTKSKSEERVEQIEHTFQWRKCGIINSAHNFIKLFICVSIFFYFLYYFWYYLLSEKEKLKNCTPCNSKFRQFRESKPKSCPLTAKGWHELHLSSQCTHQMYTFSTCGVMSYTCM